MRKVVFSVFMTVLCTLTLLGNLGAQEAFASSARPASFNCSTQCSSWTYWNGTTYGGAVTMTVSDPSFHSSPATWDRFLMVASPANPKILAGLFKSVGGGFGNYCAGAGTGLHYGVYGYDASGFNDFNLCLPVPASDVNYTATFLISINEAVCHDSDGLLDEYHVQFSFHDFSNSACVDNEATSYSRMRLNEDITDSAVTGHQVWGSQWTGSSYATQAGSFVAQSRAVDFLTARNPPQMYWHTNPVPGNNGGDLYSCVYDTGTTCTPGS